jgi:CRISPR/Cas system-associated protein Cas7 (RAMP superfamily)
MKAINFLDGIYGSGLYFITSGQVRRAIGREDIFEEISNPRDREKRIEDLSKTLEKEINDSFTVKIERKLDPEVEAQIDVMKDVKKAK